MKYLVTEFKIECQDGMIQIARDLLTDALGEAGFETFEDK
jgi:ribosomal protein L11 methyltransferase